jgi:5-methylcytosine-specific restriction endonuclease McrA
MPTVTPPTLALAGLARHRSLWSDVVPRALVRDYLYEQQRGRCAICSIEDKWNGVNLALIVDHANGDPSNNRRENLRLICPNCDSQLPTFKARNRGSGRHYRRQRYAYGQSY